ncbi:MAG: SAM-dependent methyltransferase [Methylophilus sp.]|nr:SAM-dependent methyltransferase [Methylophilus sp.]
MASLPIPSAQALAHSAQLQSLIQQHIQQQGGWIDFATFMHMALYTPNLGYYSGGAKKFGIGGDFVTAPEISPLFTRALARQVAQVIVLTQGDILELGAGTGKLAADLLQELEQLDALPSQYCILEVSDYLRQIQRDNLQNWLPDALFGRLVWLDALPTQWRGMILGNEVLDAIPVHIVGKQQGVLVERGVIWQDGFAWQDRPLTSGPMLEAVIALNLPDAYLTEIAPAATGLMLSLSERLQHGVICMLDYGFGASEYYHPQRNTGTLMCHYQHYAHSDPLIHVGLQDITAHVNFTAMAEAAHTQQLSVMGYVNQANFLINSGILQLLEQVSPEQMAVYAPMVSAVQKLLSPAEMGELFKVVLFGRGMNVPLLGAIQGDKRHML